MQVFLWLTMLGLTSLSASLLLTPVCRKFALRFGLVDRADEKRKVHKGDIPRVGGIAIMAAYFLSFLLLMVASGNGMALPGAHSALLWRMLPPVAIIFATGLIDDLVKLSPRQKLGGQFFAAVLACCAGVRIMAVGDMHTTAWWTFPLTVVWLIACTNAFNLIDGVDGLASGVGLFATVTTMLAALIQGNTGLALATMPLAGALLGFLRYNFNPASIFLGDCGSLSVGFMLGCYSVIWSEKSATLLGMTAPLMMMSVPLLDTSLSIARRFLRNKPIFGADRGHIHHQLLARGLSPRGVALTMYAVCGVAAILSLLQSIFYYRFGGLVIVMFCLVVCVCVQRLRYIEFCVLLEMLAPVSVRRRLQEEIRMRHFKADLGMATTLDEFWSVICATAHECEFRRVFLQVGDRTFEFMPEEQSSANCWHFNIALSPDTHLRLDHDQLPAKLKGVYPFVEAVQSVLSANFPAAPQRTSFQFLMQPAAGAGRSQSAGAR